MQIGSEGLVDRGIACPPCVDVVLDAVSERRRRWFLDVGQIFSHMVVAFTDGEVIGGHFAMISGLMICVFLFDKAFGFRQVSGLRREV